MYMFEHVQNNGLSNGYHFTQKKVSIIYVYIKKGFFVMKRKANENKFVPVIFYLFCCNAVRYKYFDNSYFRNCTNIYI